MKELNVNKVALSFAFFLGGWHLLWSFFVAIGFAQTLLDFVFWLHMLNNPLKVAQFSFTTALILVLFTGVVGYLGGFVFATLWNRLHQN